MRLILKMLGAAGLAGALSLMTTAVDAKELTFSYVAAGLQYPFNVSVATGFHDASSMVTAFR